MKAITVRQPWASMIAAGVKTIETRPAPPNGPMRPGGVRGLPGHRIDRGERIAIHAASDHTDLDRVWAAADSSLGLRSWIEEHWPNEGDR